MIELEGLSVRYGAQPALEDVSLRVGAGEFVLISGPSGCGKSTLARVLAGLIPAVIPARVEGRAQVAGLDPSRTRPADLATRVGLVFQNPATQLFCLTVEEEIAFGPRCLGLDGDEVSERVDWALQATGLEGMRGRAPLELSGGGQQRLAIAAALALRSPLLVLDEPLASLDRPGARQVLRTLIDLHQRHGATIVMIEHRLAEASRAAGRIVLMDRGRIVADGPADVVSADRAQLRGLGLARPGTRPAWDRTAERGRTDGEALVELRGVSAGYNGRTVLDGIDLCLYPGEFVALVGENGSGKSTLARVLAGLMRPRGGRRITPGGGRARPDRDVGLLCQNPLDQLLTECVDDEVALGPRNWAVFDRATHEETLAAADLIALRERAPLALSVGQQQRTALAAALALAPRLLILDEPTLGQDWSHLERLMDFVAGLHARGSTILLITHDHDLAARYARRLLLMREGCIVMDGGPEGLAAVEP
jgi:energy-coupling factor transport system ATP-binding protein